MTDVGVSLPPEKASVAAARRHVEQVLDGWGAGAASWACQQLISELATNAVIHAKTDFTVELSRHGDVIRGCVHDSSPAEPGVRRYSQDATTGRGMRLVESMATAWGVDRTGTGKTIWFELDAGGNGTAQAWDDGDDIDLDVLLSQFDGADSDVGSPRAAARNAQDLLAPLPPASRRRLRTPRYEVGQAA